VEAVRAGELTLEQAAAMMDTLEDEFEDDDDYYGEYAGLEEWINDVAEELEEAVERGDLTEEEAWEKWYGFKEHQLAPKLKVMVLRGDMSEEDALAIWHEIETAEAVERGELTEEEAQTGLRDHYIRLGIDDERMGRIKKALAEKGVEDEQMELALGCILRLAHASGSENPEAEASGIKTYLEDEAGFTDEQIELMARLGERVGMSMTDRGERRREGRENPGAMLEGMKRRLDAAVESGDMTQGQADERMEHFRERFDSERGDRPDFYKNERRDGDKAEDEGTPDER
jgi:polyhydroxyalkanoate synthesis regulator phasin